ncbi:MAG TPA: hydroxymethylbilane synthase [Methylomirabilota bacterium]|nr:hydroxymethylbilane synthase [Methylomirabilota bacterium]
MPEPRTIRIASRGSALALAQTNLIKARCEAAFPRLRFEVQIIKTTGDRMQTMALNNPVQESTKGLFTKELEVALLDRSCDFAVHSLKDLPTELPSGLKLGAVPEREDVRDILIYRHAGAGTQSKARGQDAPLPFGAPSGAVVKDFPSGATIATSSTRRQAQLLAIRSDLKLVPIRGNVGTRLQKLADQKELDGIILAAAGVRRLGFSINEAGELSGQHVPAGLQAVFLGTVEMIPCVGQAALGIEIRENDPELESICAGLNHPSTHACVLAERAFLRHMGGGCLSPVAAYAQISREQLAIRGISFRNEMVRKGEVAGPVADAENLGVKLADQLGAGIT